MKGVAKMPIFKNREYRSFAFTNNQAQEKRIDSDFYIEGYATTFNDPYLMIETEEFKIYEQIDRNALTGADMSDVKFQINHENTVYARMKQKTLGIEVNDKGILTYADLSKTTSARERYEEIEAGYIDQMSWAFTVAEQRFDWNDDLTVCTRSIDKVKKVYEVSGVTNPANPNTDLGVRTMIENNGNNGETRIIKDLLNGAIESRQQELLKRKEIKKQILRIKLKLMEVQ